MVAVFRRSLSFPNKPPAPTARQPNPRISRHLRSISLPCRSHPLISSLKDEIANLKSWPSTDHRNAAWLCRGLSALKLVHDYLDDILQLPQSRESMCRLSTWVENVLEHFLRFIDAYGIFNGLILAFRQDHVAAHVAIRRKDDTKLHLYTKARKRMGKETTQLVSGVRAAKAAAEGTAVSDEELAAAIMDVMEVTATVSVAAFEGIGVSLGSRRKRWTGKMKKIENGILEFMEVSKKGEDEVKVGMEKMKDLEEAIRCIESGSQKLFRSLINTRVSILNALSH